MKTKHTIALYIVSFLLASGCTRKIDQSKGITMPNVIIFLADDQGWGDLSLHGNRNLDTPHIDKLAEEGAVFDRFYVAPVCSPTRAEFLTGRYSPRCGVYSTSAGGERMDLDETTMAEIFQRAGYTTAAFGKWHNGSQYPYHPNGRGFEEFYGFCSGHWGNYFNPMLEHNGEIVRGEGFIIDDLTDRAIDFMSENAETPFFLYLPFNTPHSPMQVPDPYWDKFQSMELIDRDIDPGLENIMHTKAALAMCENIDWNVGRIVQKVKDMGLEENTIMVYFSDNGPNGRRWNDGMKGRKGSTDEGGVRSPLIIQWKGKVNPGQKIEEISAAIDLLPTLADLTGIELETNHPLDGISLKPLLMEPISTWQDRYIFNHWAGRTSVRSQRFRLDADNRLFDMVQDPGQGVDIGENYMVIRDQMIQAKNEWIENVLSELPEEDRRAFPLGHPNTVYTQIPARDGTCYGNVVRSNKYPNCSFFTGWKSIHDSITWPVEVLEEGLFDVDIYYTCPENDVGSIYELSIGGASIVDTILVAHDPPLYGMENDRDPRIESYVKDFRLKNIGEIRLKKGTTSIRLSALDIPGKQVMDLRLLMFRRGNGS